MDNAIVKEKDGVRYDCEMVRHGGKAVGRAPVVADKDFADKLARLGEEKLFVLAERQEKQDAMNLVRSKFQVAKVTASAAMKGIAAGSVDVVKATEEVKAGKYKTFTDACAAQLGIGKDAMKDVDSEKIHWDIL